MKKIFKIASVLMLVFLGGLLEMITDPKTHITTMEMCLCALICLVLVIGTLFVGLIMDYTDLAGHYSTEAEARNIAESEVHRLTYTNREMRTKHEKLVAAINKLSQKKPDESGAKN